MEFLESKWPMLELIEFAKAITHGNSNLKVLPLFYKIGVEHLKRERDRIASIVQDRRVSSTEDYGARLHALKLLAGINGENQSWLTEGRLWLPYANVVRQRFNLMYLSCRAEIGCVML